MTALRLPKSPKVVDVQLMYLYGRSVDWISRLMDESPYLVRQWVKGLAQAFHPEHETSSRAR